MAQHSSRFFTTKGRKASNIFQAGVLLFHHGRQIGSIAQDRENKLFNVSLVTGYCEEFATFEEADKFAWIRGL